MGIGWKSSFGTGLGRGVMGSGLEVVWTNTPTKWDNSFLEILYGYEWELSKSPAGAWQHTPRDGAGAGTIPGPFGGPGRARRCCHRRLDARRPFLRADHPALDRGDVQVQLRQVRRAARRGRQGEFAADLLGHRGQRSSARPSRSSWSNPAGTENNSAIAADDAQRRDVVERRRRAQPVGHQCGDLLPVGRHRR